MRFFGLTATEFTLLFAGAAGLAVFFYLLSFRLRKLVVATDPIWRQVVGRRRTPFRKLLALLGQILILFLLSLALADPRIVPPERQAPVAAVVVVDISASMGARLRESTRLDEAKGLVLALIEQMGPRDRLMLMVMDDGCRPLTAFSSDTEELERATDSLQSGGMPENFDAAMNFALSSLQRDGLPEELRRRLVFISDHFHKPDPNLDFGEVELLQVALGKPMGNLALTAFDVRRRGGAAAGSELFVEVSNHGARDRFAKLSIHTEHDLLGEEQLSIKARGRLSRSFFMEPGKARHIMATLTPKAGRGSVDGFVVDDRAFAVVPERRARRILVVSSGNLYIEMALKLDPSLDVQVIRPEQFQSGMLANFQAAVFDGLCPASSIPALYFSVPDASACPFVVDALVEKPRLLPMRGDHPVSQALTLVDVQIRRAHRLKPRAGDVELLADEGGPLVIAREEGALRSLAFGFDVAESDLPLRVAFPMLLHNAMVWFLGEDLDLGFDENAVGRVLRLPDWVDEKTRIETPDGQVVVAQALGGRPMLRPRVPGFYKLHRGDRSQIIPVNFHNERESRLWGERQPGPGRMLWAPDTDVPSALVDGFDKRVFEYPPMQWPIVLLVIAWLLLFDWVFFCFRILF